MLELDHVTRQFRNTVVLRDMTFAVRDGEIVSILGPSGCGKTTLLNIILGILSPTEGRILCDGQDVTKVPMRERGFKDRKSVV